MMFTSTSIETITGRIIDLANVTAADLDIQDIVWSLSHQGRFGGHSISDDPYTVAQHVVEVSYILEEALNPGTHLFEVFGEYLEGNVETAALFLVHQKTAFENGHVQKYAFHALMHDFAEAYLTDLPTPVKRLPGVYEAYKNFELKYDALIYEHFGLAYSQTRFPFMWAFARVAVGWADAYALMIEAYHFMPSRGKTWNQSLPRPTQEYLNKYEVWEPRFAREQLMKRFDELKPIKP